MNSDGMTKQKLRVLGMNYIADGAANCAIACGYIKINSKFAKHSMCLEYAKSLLQ